MKQIKKLFFILITMSGMFQIINAETVVQVSYFKNIYGHVHIHPSSYSESLTTIACGHPIKVYSEAPKVSGRKVFMSKEWSYVKVGMHKGYLKRDVLSSKRPLCFQDMYPKFFDSFDLDLSELYYWGRLYGQYIQGRSRVR